MSEEYKSQTFNSSIYPELIPNEQKVTDKLFGDLCQEVKVKDSMINKQFIQANEINEASTSLTTPSSTAPSSTGILSYVTHSQAIYTSRLLVLKNLPVPKNAECDDDDLGKLKFYMFVFMKSFL